MTETELGASSAPPIHTNNAALTWQQQLLNESQAQKKKNTKRPQEKRAPKPKADNAKPKPKEADSATPSSALTWQQELFRQSQRPAAFDYAADSRDVETFGEGKGRATGAASTPDRRKNKAKPRVESKSPSTPNKKVAAAMAYAGPTFHNSPAATSLPAPKFGGKSKITFVDDTHAVTGTSVTVPVSASAVPDTAAEDAASAGADTSSMSLPPSVTATEPAAPPSSALSPPLSDTRPSVPPHNVSQSQAPLARPPQDPRAAFSPPHQHMPVQPMPGAYAYQPHPGAQYPPAGPPPGAYMPYPPSMAPPPAHLYAPAAGPGPYSPAPAPHGAAPQRTAASNAAQYPSAAPSAPAPGTASSNTAGTAASTPTNAKFQSVDNLLASMLNSSSLFRR